MTSEPDHSVFHYKMRLVFFSVVVGLLLWWLL